MADPSADLVLKIVGGVVGLLSSGGALYGFGRWLSGIFTTIQQDGIKSREDFKAALGNLTAAQERLEQAHRDQLKDQREADERRHALTMTTLKVIEDNCARKFEEAQRLLVSQAEDHRRTILRLTGHTDTGSFKAPPRSTPRPPSDTGRRRYDERVEDQADGEEEEAT